MSTFIIPTSQNLPFYSQSVILDGQTFITQFKWNDRDSAWYFSLYTEAGEGIVVGSRICVETPLLRRVSSESAPLGEIIAHDTLNTDVDPAFEELGTRVIMLYFDQEEMESLNA